jgi:hypothetical protein
VICLLEGSYDNKSHGDIRREFSEANITHGDMAFKGFFMTINSTVTISGNSLQLTPPTVISLLEGFITIKTTVTFAGRSVKLTSPTLLSL